MKVVLQIPDLSMEIDSLLSLSEDATVTPAVLVGIMLPDLQYWAAEYLRKYARRHHLDTASDQAGLVVMNRER